MKLLILIGNSAVGKMTVGQELMKITDLCLFHNHMIIEPVIDVFGDFNGSVIARLREVIFEEFASSDAYGMIFTYMWAFDQTADWQYIDRVREIFERKSSEVYYVELIAPQEVRLQRNLTENRLRYKASKRDIDASNQRLLDDDRHYCCESYEGEFPYANYLRIENAALSPEEVARRIKTHFAL